MMTTPDANPASQPDDASFSSKLIPNRTYARIWRGLAIFFLIVGAWASVSPFHALLSELDARVRWSHADGQISTIELKSAAENRSPGGSPSLSAFRTVYWAELQVAFNPPDGCRTGIVSPADSAMTFHCFAEVRTVPSKSPTNAYDWVRHHGQGSAVRLLYDPKGPGVKLADQSLLDSLSWSPLIGSLAMVVFGLLALSTAQRRLRELAYLPKDQDLPAPPSADSPRPDDLIDLKLS
jgi:hypothetical protein